MSSQVGLFIVRTNLRNRQPKRFHQAEITQSLFCRCDMLFQSKSRRNDHMANHEK